MNQKNTRFDTFDQIIKLLTRHIKYLLFITPVLVLTILRLIGFDGMVSQDNYAYIGYTEKLVQYLYQGKSAEPFFWAPGYSLTGAMLAWTSWPVSLIMQLINTIAFSVMLILFYKSLTLLFTFPDKENSVILYLCLYCLFIPYLFRSAFVTSSDMFASMWLSFSIYFAIRYYVKYESLSIHGMIACLSLAFFTRYVIVIILLPAVIYFYIKWIQSRPHPIQLLLTVLIPLLIFYLNWLLQGNVDNIIQHDSVRTWNIKNLFNRSFKNKDGEVHYILPNIVYIFSPVFHPGFLWAGIFLIYKGFIDKLLRRKIILLLATGYFLFVLFLGGYHNQNPRHYLPVLLPVIICAYPGFNALWIKIKKYQKLVIACLMFIQIVLCYRALRPGISRNILDKYIADRINEGGYCGDKILYSFDIDIALKTRGVSCNIVSMYDSIIHQVPEGSLLLFNEPKLKKQWADMNPMKNYNHLKTDYQLSKVMYLQDGWELYEIRSK